MTGITTKNINRKLVFITPLVLFSFFVSPAQKKIRETTVGEGWANNSINAVIFRKNALTTHKTTQFIAYYNAEGFLTLGKRKLGDTDWKVKQTPYRGNTADAHNSISIAADGEGYLHLAWDHHNTPLRYARSKVPFGLELGEEIPMTGKEEQKVTYPEFYALPGGNLLFFYRSGSSGRGNMVVNAYNSAKKEWVQRHGNLIDGEGQRSAYWQACVDKEGTIHLSWVWRETWDVSSNHDLCYARSRDGGISWERSTGEKYSLPITAATAEYAWKIPEGSGLINQTTMASDKRGNPYIATYWKEKDIPQYQIVYNNGTRWKNITTKFRSTPFDLGGGGTKSIPISRPQLLVGSEGRKTRLYLLFRDAERGNKAAMARFTLPGDDNWVIKDLTSVSLIQWEPLYDTELWKSREELHLFVQKVEQIDGEGVANTQATPVKVVEVSLRKFYEK
ncbi:BNR repeat-containing protein [Sinomicrobium weinanense]|uniref:BNR repeat-containing protein n=1 Tax=Sinomicrobium weinanense TaxID=2842200 RepID=A0A926Q203_9FLAO|nr:BNR repeat-containing protein [Sinomicrobium weinanense]MBC9796162.1 BNR repeat-containing protein [Sinomicrobium weinanense]MBU3121913.1 BNR repeat-containing protein [Sinomicrobium weinanense]